MMSDKKFNRFFSISLAVLAIIYCIGMVLPLMDVDASTYGVISKQMFESHSFLQVYLNGQDYLDKPPFVFWAACFFFKIFAVHDWAYRLPSVLCLALGIYSTYRYAKLFYTEQVAKIAALIMASCMATYVMTSDTRTDTMLTGWVMFTIWQLAEYFNTKQSTLNIKHLLLGAMGIGFAMMTKGPIGLIIPVTAFSVEFIYKRQWMNFFRWQYLIALLVIAIILLPMSYGLYEQFDLHPEKVLYEKTGTSGLRFFYWTQSFGRITGESSWNNNPDPFFLYHSFLWSFAPWCVLFIPALYTEIRALVISHKSKVKVPEVMTVAGFVLILVFLSRSKYQLPHYTFAIHPLAAIITAKYMSGKWSVVSGQPKFNTGLFNVFYGIHIFLLIIIFAILYLIVFYVFPAPVFYPIVVSLALCCFLYVLFFKRRLPLTTYHLPLLTLIPFATLIFILNTHFYPEVLSYQKGSAVAKDLNKIAPDSSKLLLYKSYHSYSMQFYSKLPIVEFVNEQGLKQNLVHGKTFILADTIYIKEIEGVDPGISIIKRYYCHSPTLLNWKFLNPATRSENDEHRVLMKY